MRGARRACERFGSAGRSGRRRVCPGSEQDDPAAGAHPADAASRQRSRRPAARSATTVPTTPAAKALADAVTPDEARRSAQGRDRQARHKGGGSAPSA